MPEKAMNVLTTAIVSNSDMIKNYKACREKAEKLGKIFILKNNQPDAVLFSVTEYERLSVFIEYLESLEEKDIAEFLESLPREGKRKRYSLDQLKDDIKQVD
jgi:PHD/YefM family antitoxin component YafN of YafNO toxin-antitoxin module